ncbi:MAG: DMT family transporter [Tenericutes bacterium]|nr:DMT family transporter [Mycoplasmatota bacterium]
MNRNIARVVLLSAGLIWGFGFVVNKYILDSGWDDSQLLFVRFFTAAIFIFAIFLRRIIKTDKETIKSGLFLGIFLFLGFFFQTWGLEETTASKNALITAGYIVFLPLIIYIFERKIVKIKTLLAALITFIGIIVISVDFKNIQSGINIGDFLTFIGAIFWGIHIYLLGKVVKKKDPVVLMAFQLLVVSILAFIAMQIKAGIPIVDFSEWDSLKILLSGILIGFFASFIGFVFQSIGQKHSNETEAAILISTESVFGPIFAILIYHEIFNVNLIIGMVMVFLGVVLSEIDIIELLRKTKNDRANVKDKHLN